MRLRRFTLRSVTRQLVFLLFFDFFQLALRFAAAFFTQLFLQRFLLAFDLLAQRFGKIFRLGFSRGRLLLLHVFHFSLLLFVRASVIALQLLVQVGLVCSQLFRQTRRRRCLSGLCLLFTTLECTTERQ